MNILFQLNGWAAIAIMFVCFLLGKMVEGILNYRLMKKGRLP